MFKVSVGAHTRLEPRCYSTKQTSREQACTCRWCSKEDCRRVPLVQYSNVGEATDASRDCGVPEVPDESHGSCKAVASIFGASTQCASTQCASTQCASNSSASNSCAATHCIKTRSTTARGGTTFTRDESLASASRVDPEFSCQDHQRTDGSWSTRFARWPTQ